MSLRTVRRNVPVTPVSSAVMQTSPSPCTPWPSPAKNNAPSLNTGRYSVVPGRSSLLSMLPPKQRGTGEPQRPQLGGGAVAMMPKNGSSGISGAPWHDADFALAVDHGMDRFIIGEFVRQRSEQRQDRYEAPVLTDLYVEDVDLKRVAGLAPLHIDWARDEMRSRSCCIVSSAVR